MLEKANRLKSNDPYIIDSLGWALFKLERYTESKDYLQLAVKLMPSDPIVQMIIMVMCFGKMEIKFKQDIIGVMF